MSHSGTPAPDQLTVLPKCHELLTILHEDNDFLLINKPAGLLSVPGRNPANGDCVKSRLELEFPGVSIVHRLDFDTSGIMVVARNKLAHAAIARQFQERTVNKRYYARAYGLPSPPEGRVDLPIVADKEHRPKYKICQETGKASITDYRVLEYDEANEISRLSLEPLTGRSHQLRLHMAAIGYPLLGCVFYAPERVQQMAANLQLHAADLRFRHPKTQQWVEGSSPCPF